MMTGEFQRREARIERRVVEANLGLGLRTIESLGNKLRAARDASVWVGGAYLLVEMALMERDLLDELEYVDRCRRYLVRPAHADCSSCAGGRFEPGVKVCEDGVWVCQECGV